MSAPPAVPATAPVTTLPISASGRRPRSDNAKSHTDRQAFALLTVQIYAV